MAHADLGVPVCADSERLAGMEINDVTRSSLKKLAVSKSRSQRGAVVHNTAMDESLHHTLKTMEDLKLKARRAIDYDQQKFLQSLSTSTENLSRRDGSGEEEEPHTAHSDESLAVSNESSPQTSRKKASHGRRPRTAGASLDFTRDAALHRSKSLSSGAKPKKGGAPKQQSSALDLYDKEKEARQYRYPDAAESRAPRPQYSISSNMKICESRGGAKDASGKGGLASWMGGRSPKNSESPNNHHK